MNPELKAARAEARRNFVNPFVPGDVIYNSWGYDQTNIDFYVVERVTPQGVWIAPLAATTEETGFMSGKKVPKRREHLLKLEYETTGPAELHRAYSGYQRGAYVHFKYGSGQKWHGQPVRCSWYA